MITLKRIIHRNQKRILISFPYDSNMIAKVRKITDARWSKTQKSWHVPDNEESIRLICELFPDSNLNDISNAKTSSSNVTDNIATKEGPNDNRNADDVHIEVLGRKIIVKLPKKVEDVSFLNTIKYSRWNFRYYHWEIPNYPGNLEKLTDYFGARIKDVVKHEKFDVELGNQTLVVGNYEIVVIKTRRMRLKIIFAYNAELSKMIKRYPYYTWDSKNKWWSIPYSDRYLNEIQEFAIDKGMKFKYEEELKDLDGVKRISKYDVANYRSCPKEMMLKLKELRLSENTMRTYKAMFEEFINYYNKFEIDLITEKQITAFLRYLVIERKVSSSYQNQSINAIKF